MRVAAFDPGTSSGAAAVIDSGGVCLGVIDLPMTGAGPSVRIDAKRLQNWMMQFKPEVGVVEAAQSFPGQGIASSFRYGRGAGAIEATVMCSGIPLKLVSPITWKNYFGLRVSDEDRAGLDKAALVRRLKELSRALAMARFPDSKHALEHKGDHGKAEAMLIALWAQETNLGTVIGKPAITRAQERRERTEPSFV